MVDYIRVFDLGKRDDRTRDAEIRDHYTFDAIPIVRKHRFWCIRNLNHGRYRTPDAVWDIQLKVSHMYRTIGSLATFYSRPVQERHYKDRLTVSISFYDLFAFMRYRFEVLCEEP